MDIKECMQECYQITKDHGFWDGDRNDAECIALMHSELSEALEWLRTKDNDGSPHIPAFRGIEEEMADVLIRVFDYCEGRGLDLEGALKAKMEFNKDRPYKHGKKM